MILEYTYMGMPDISYVKKFKFLRLNDLSKVT